jgi:PadR family transcriptional regulator, regulatory protein AphA
MSSEPRLGHVSFLVLGIVAMRGASTPYDLKRFVERSIGHFWPFPHTQLYTEPERLAAAGLLDETREEGGRRRRHYTITPAGRARLEAWLAEPETAPTEYRDVGVLKLFFAELSTPDDVEALARTQAAAQRQVLALYEGFISRYGDRPEYRPRLRSAEMGIRFTRAAIDFWDEVAAQPGT